jgi:uncharacterized repeat protein (TIGR03847 family)
MTSDDHELARYDLGICSTIRAEAVGRPGERYFRLRADAERGTALLWMDKEQLYDLALAIKRMMNRQMDGSHVERLGVQGDFAADYDFRISQLAIHRDPETGLYVVLASQVGGDDEDEDDRESEWAATTSTSDVALRVQEEQLDRLADEALAVCASGRPRCALCGAPLNEGETHTCPRANGHHKVEP